MICNVTKKEMMLNIFGLAGVIYLLIAIEKKKKINLKIFYRCGDKFVVSEAELEEGVDLVFCRSCSFAIKINV